MLSCQGYEPSFCLISMLCTSVALHHLVAYKPITWEAEAGKLPQIWGYLGLHALLPVWAICEDLSSKKGEGRYMNCLFLVSFTLGQLAISNQKHKFKNRPKTITKSWYTFSHSDWFHSWHTDKGLILKLHVAWVLMEISGKEASINLLKGGCPSFLADCGCMGTQ